MKPRKKCPRKGDSLKRDGWYKGAWARPGQRERLRTRRRILVLEAGMVPEGVHDPLDLWCDCYVILPRWAADGVRIPRSFRKQLEGPCP